MGNKYPLPPPNVPPPSRDELPKAEFQDLHETRRIVTKDKVLLKYGYRGETNWKRPPGEYMQYKPPTEAELMQQVEYDMDEQDEAWLDIVNKRQREKKKGASGEISKEFFEVTIDRLEKEWFKMMELVPKKQMQITEADSQCAVCDDGDAENSNAIVFCDGCNIAVHQDCYGIPYVPEGQWLCRKCDLSPEAPVSCELCPNTWGAYKQTTSGGWVHLICALWIPETTIQNVIYMEPVENVNKIQDARRKLVCVICNQKRSGKPCIQCSVNSCRVAFHVTCARARGLFMKLGMKVSRHDGAPDGDLEWEKMIAYCEKHSPVGYDVPNLPPGEKFLPTSQEQRFRAMTGDSKAARAYGDIQIEDNNIRRFHPFNVPNYIFDKVLDHLRHFPTPLREKREMLQLICKFWGLKREARRGAVLLKRLHLEPWGSRNFEADDKEIEMKRVELEKLRGNIDHFRRNILTTVVERDELKKQSGEVLKNFADEFLFAGPSAIFTRIVETLKKLDSARYFHKPVDKHDYPQYRDVIKQPMDFTTILDKIARREYITLKEFQNDLFLIYSNAQIFNPVGHTVYKAAEKGQLKAEELLAVAASEMKKIQFEEEVLRKVITVSFVNELFTPKTGQIPPLNALLSEAAVIWKDPNDEVESKPLHIDKAKKWKKTDKRRLTENIEGAPPMKKKKVAFNESQAEESQSTFVTLASTNDVVKPVAGVSLQGKADVVEDAKMPPADHDKSLVSTTTELQLATVAPTRIDGQKQGGLIPTTSLEALTEKDYFLLLYTGKTVFEEGIKRKRNSVNYNLNTRTSKKQPSKFESSPRIVTSNIMKEASTPTSNSPEVPSSVAMTLQSTGGTDMQDQDSSDLSELSSEEEEKSDIAKRKAVGKNDTRKKKRRKVNQSWDKKKKSSSKPKTSTPVPIKNLALPTEGAHLLEDTRVPESTGPATSEPFVNLDITNAGVSLSALMTVPVDALVVTGPEGDAEKAIETPQAEIGPTNALASASSPPVDLIPMSINGTPNPGLSIPSPTRELDRHMDMPTVGVPTSNESDGLHMEHHHQQLDSSARSHTTKRRNERVHSTGLDNGSSNSEETEVDTSHKTVLRTSPRKKFDTQQSPRKPPTAAKGKKGRITKKSHPDDVSLHEGSPSKWHDETLSQISNNKQVEQVASPLSVSEGSLEQDAIEPVSQISPELTVPVALSRLQFPPPPGYVDEAYERLTAMTSKQKVESKKKIAELRRKYAFPDNYRFQDGELVWAKGKANSKNYPWLPGEVFVSKKEIPEKLHDLPDSSLAIMYYTSFGSYLRPWEPVTRSKILPFGEPDSKEVDEFLSSPEAIIASTSLKGEELKQHIYHQYSVNKWALESLDQGEDESGN